MTVPLLATAGGMKWLPCAGTAEDEEIGELVPKMLNLES
jgi:hypothetical protein